MEKITQATSGKVTFQFYSDAALGGPVVHYDLAVNGVADIIFYNFASQLGRFPLIDALQMPFVTPNADAGSYGFFKLYSDFPELRDQLKQVKVINLGMNDPTFPDTTTRAGQVKTLADLRGKKIRVSGPEGQTLTALGGTPVSIVDMGEVYLSLSNGILDGLIIGNQALVSFKFGEVVHYYTQWDGPAIRCLPFGFFMNMDKWNSLPKDIQDAIMSVSGVAATEQTSEGSGTRQIEAQTLEAIKKAGYEMKVSELEAGQEAKIKEISGKPVQDKWAADMQAKNLPGKKVIDDINSLLDKYGK
jgi:TRAP-type transport system periplasmic protein